MISTIRNHLTPELRAIEVVVDSCHRTNLLMQKRFAEAAWYLVAFAEDTVLKSALTGQVTSPQIDALLADNLVNNLNYPLYWLYRACRTGGEVPFSFQSDLYQAAWDLLTLGEQYLYFATAFTYASRGIIELTVQGSTVRPSNEIFDNFAYEAYTRLMNPKIPPGWSSETFPADRIRRSLTINDDRFTYKLTPDLVSRAKLALHPLLRVAAVIDSLRLSQITTDIKARSMEPKRNQSVTHYARFSARSPTNE